MRRVLHSEALARTRRYRTLSVACAHLANTARLLVVRIPATPGWCNGLRNAEKETDTGGGAGGAAAGHAHMRHNMRVPDDGCAEWRGHRVPDRSHLHADDARISVRHIGEPGHMHHH